MEALQKFKRAGKFLWIHVPCGRILTANGSAGPNDPTAGWGCRKCGNVEPDGRWRPIFVSQEYRPKIPKPPN